MSVNQAGGYVRSTPEQTAPDLQLYFNAITYDMSGKPQHGKLLNPHPYPAFFPVLRYLPPGKPGRNQHPLSRPATGTGDSPQLPERGTGHTNRTGRLPTAAAAGGSTSPGQPD
ncbi:MAG: hypothetical protein R3E95_20250 [Thiolinea sp.]